MKEQTLSAQLKALKNLSAFSKHSGIPRRTLERVKAVPDHPVSPTTRVAILGALKYYKDEK